MILTIVSLMLWRSIETVVWEREPSELESIPHNLTACMDHAGDEWLHLFSGQNLLHEVGMCF